MVWWISYHLTYLLPSVKLSIYNKKERSHKVCRWNKQDRDPILRQNGKTSGDLHGLCAEFEIPIQNAAAKRASMICINRTQNRKMELLPLYLSLLPQYDTGVLYQNGKLGRVQRSHVKIVSHIKLIPIPEGNGAALHWG